MPDASVDAVVTDPPYNEVNRASNGLRVLDKGAADSSVIRVRPLAAELARISRGWLFVWCGTEQVSLWRRAFVRQGLSTRVGVWHKTDPSPMNGEYLYLSAVELCVIAKKPGAPFFRHCVHPVWRGPVERNIDWHPTPKPVWLMRELIEATVPPGGLVLDPFMGSGATGVAALSNGYGFIGCELNPEWAEKARRRLEDSPLSLFGAA